ncbi:MAG: glycosyltransferase [Gemmatimonadetes bacterium]|nr:glycosyltransferase [Gemmatimonadota bacterium]
MMPPVWFLAALPWIVLPAVLLWRARGSVELSAYEPFGATDSASPPSSASQPSSSPLVSIIVPARNEARNIEACLRSILSTTLRSIEVIVVDDHSSDGTGGIARRMAAGDARVTVTDAPPLPDGWFGKQWACHSAVQIARGTILLFTDADTRHTPELLPRALQALHERGADLLSVMGAQELGGFWERLLQPQVFTFILGRYGNTEAMSRSNRPVDKIANGQFFLVKRALYDKCGGHEAVRDHVAEDLRMAQEVCRAGGVVHFVEGREFLSTRMYEGLGELMRGWGKNVYAGGRDSLELGVLGRAVLRIVFPVPALWNVWPVALGLVAATGVLPAAVLWWGVTCYAASVLFWMMVNHEFGVPVWYAFLYPVAAAMMAWLLGVAALRGDRVEWKGRKYRSVAAGARR